MTLKASVKTSLRDLRAIGQLLIIGFDGTEVTSRLRSLLTRLQPAGVILFKRNVQNAQQTWHLLHDCQKYVSTPLFKCVDLEGGVVDRFRDVLGPTPSAADVFSTDDHKLYRKHGLIIGENCCSLGFNVDFAPSFDLALEASRAVMSSRVVSANPRDTIAYARGFLAGLRGAKVLGCGKHFPGLGEGKLDSHHELPIIDKSLKKLWTEDLAPYRALHRKLPLVMVAHAAYPQVTGDRVPASLSTIWISDFLRKRIKYRGLIVSDDLEMGGVLSSASIGEAAVKSIQAGSDLCLICHHEQHVIEAYEALAKRAERDDQFARRVTESARRVLKFKKASTKLLQEAKVPSTTTIEKLSRKLWEFSEQVRLASLSRTERSRSRA